MNSKVVFIAIILFGWTSLASNLLSQNTIIPMQLAGKLILLKGKANGKQGHFILDLGASGLVLNNRYFEGKDDDDLEVYSVNSTLPNLQTCIVALSIDEISWKGVKAILLSLAHLE